MISDYLSNVCQLNLTDRVVDFRLVQPYSLNTSLVIAAEPRKCLRPPQRAGECRAGQARREGTASSRGFEIVGPNRGESGDRGLTGTYPSNTP